MANGVRMEVYNRFHIIWDIIPSTWSDWDEKLRVWINAGDMTTMAFWNYNLTDYINYCDQGLLGEFPEGWETNFPNVQQAMVAGVIGYPVAELVGGHFSLPHAIVFNLPVTPYVTQWGFHARADWIEKAGYEVKTAYTRSEIINMMKDMMARADELGLTKGTDYMYANDASRTWNHFFQWSDGFKEGIIWDAATQQYVWGAERDYDRILSNLEAYRQGVADGWIHPDYYAWTGNREERDLFYAGNLFLVSAEGFAASLDSIYKDFKKGTGLDPWENLVTLIVTDDSGVLHMDEQLNYWAGLIWSPTIEDDLFNRLLDLCNWKLSDEGKYTCYLGIEGKDYTINDDGSFTITREIDPETGNFKSIGKLYPQCKIFGSFAICGDDFGSWNPSLEPASIEAANKLWATKQEVCHDKGGVLPYDWEYWFYQDEIKQKYNIDFSAKATEWVAAATSEADLKASLDAFIAEQKPLVTEVINKLNTDVTPTKIANAG